MKEKKLIQGLLGKQSIFFKFVLSYINIFQNREKKILNF
jgi:hypothetical protein